jgi:hypothetical protein
MAQGGRRGRRGRREQDATARRTFYAGRSERSGKEAKREKQQAIPGFFAQILGQAALTSTFILL